MPTWTLHGNGRTVEPNQVVRPDERLNWGATIAIGVQHVIAMFGATFLVPVLTGFPVPTTLLTVPLGARLAHSLSQHRLRQLFGIFLGITAGRMLWDAITAAMGS